MIACRVNYNNRGTSCSWAKDKWQLHCRRVTRIATDVEFFEILNFGWVFWGNNLFNRVKLQQNACLVWEKLCDLCVSAEQWPVQQFTVKTRTATLLFTLSVFSFDDILVKGGRTSVWFVVHCLSLEQNTDLNCSFWKKQIKTRNYQFCLKLFLRFTQRVPLLTQDCRCLCWSI